MLIEFTFENFKCYRDETTLQMAAVQSVSMQRRLSPLRAGKVFCLSRRFTDPTAEESLACCRPSRVLSAWSPCRTLF